MGDNNYNGDGYQMPYQGQPAGSPSYPPQQDGYQQPAPNGMPVSPQQPYQQYQYPPTYPAYQGYAPQYPPQQYQQGWQQPPVRAQGGAAPKAKKGGCAASCVAIAAILVVALLACFAIVGVVVNSYTNGGSSSDGGEDGAVAPSQFTQDRKGEVLYDGPDMTVTYGSLADSGVGAAILSLTVENKTSRDVSCIAEAGATDVNGYNVQPIGGSDIQAGKKAVTQFVISLNQANISSIDEITSISMNVKLIVLGASVDAVASAPISIEF